MNLTYKIINNGYVILNDGMEWIVQENYIPYPGDTLEQSAKNHIEELLKQKGQEKSQAATIEDLKKQIDIQNQAIAELTMFLTMGK